MNKVREDESVVFTIESGYMAVMDDDFKKDFVSQDLVFPSCYCTICVRCKLERCVPLHLAYMYTEQNEKMALRGEKPQNHIALGHLPERGRQK